MIIKNSYCSVGILLIILFASFIFGYQGIVISKSHAQGQANDTKTIRIVKGSANPEVDITDLSPKQWYDPRVITVNVNETIKWTNNDTEPHTVTSGIGGGISSVLTNGRGTPNGLFDSGLFSPGSAVSIHFNKTGVYNYFCTIHPWMEGVVKVVGSNESSAIPSFAVNGQGEKIQDFPMYNFTADKKTEIGLTWTPQSILTNKQVSFLMDFYEFPGNTRAHLWPYNFVVLQGGKELYRTQGISQVGSSSEPYVFNQPGKVTVKIENTQNPSQFAEFDTMVYKNPYGNATNIQNVSNQTFNLISPLTLVYLVYIIIIGIPVAFVVIMILYKKGKI
ncbi:MAG: plastocyanin/azurin family copper-binding protein [Candidatus Nitrosocosmicus sp.]|nr:plastocyanin/azurin family copper-binding protein [Candidatus Nitrosocosmicus sp.]